jgi:hypothetical protein
MRPECAAILIVFDSDDDCPKHLAPQVQSWAASEAAPVPCFVVMPTREYEAWFLATIESLRGVRGILPQASSAPDPEIRRGAAEEVTETDGPKSGLQQDRRPARVPSPLRYGHRLRSLPIVPADGTRFRSDRRERWNCP